MRRPPPRILAAARFLLGQTQAEVAEDSGISAKTVFKAENGAAGIASVEKLVRHYAGRGITLIQPTESSGWGIQTEFLRTDYDDESTASGRASS